MTDEERKAVDQLIKYCYSCSEIADKLRLPVEEVTAYKKSLIPLYEVNGIVTHMEHVNRIRTGYVMLDNLPISTLTEEYSGLTHESAWVFRPMYDNMEILRARGLHPDIDGIALRTKEEEYVNFFLPEFVEQRVIPRGRGDVRWFLDEVKLNGYDPFEMMCRNHGLCGANNLYFSRDPKSVIDVHKRGPFYEIPDWDTYQYGWLSS